MIVVDISEVTEVAVTKRQWVQMHSLEAVKDGLAEGEYGYAEHPGMEKQTRQILRMELDEIDLDEVVAALMGWHPTENMKVVTR